MRKWFLRIYWNMFLAAAQKEDYKTLIRYANIKLNNLKTNKK